MTRGTVFVAVLWALVAGTAFGEAGLANVVLAVSVLAVAAGVVWLRRRGSAP